MSKAKNSKEGDGMAKSIKVQNDFVELIAALQVEENKADGKDMKTFIKMVKDNVAMWAARWDAVQEAKR